jgi:hypothetical protein
MSPSHFHTSTNPLFRTTHRPWRHPHPRPNSSSNTQPPSPNYRLPTRPPPTTSPASTNPRLATLNPALKVPLVSIPTPVTCHQGSNENHLSPFHLSSSRAKPCSIGTRQQLRPRTHSTFHVQSTGVSYFTAAPAAASKGCV